MKANLNIKGKQYQVDDQSNGIQDRSNRVNHSNRVRSLSPGLSIGPSQQLPPPAQQQSNHNINGQNKNNNLGTTERAERNNNSSSSSSSSSSISNNNNNNKLSNQSSLTQKTDKLIEKLEKNNAATKIDIDNAINMIKPPSHDLFKSRYWKDPPVSGEGNIVVIHVCDESRNTTKDFCCKRNILVKHMEYFDKFLAENENGYDDIDISVHCDIEIFEWLMCYIHEPDHPPTLDSAIVVSILISSEFLQMDKLVDLCLEHVGNNLSEIIKLPIDLSCISEKLINKLAVITSPTILSVTKDRKDKILNKLYKRRVEIDFSRKNNSKGGDKTIASSLTCCRYCGDVFLESYCTMLSCRLSFPTIEFRGKLMRRHSSIPNWSLTSYLKLLHSGGMNWEHIYWHVWAACTVIKSHDIIISVSDVDRYTIDSDSIIINHRPISINSPTQSTSAIIKQKPFSLHVEDTFSMKITERKIYFQEKDDYPSSIYTSTLNPNRPADYLTQEIFELIKSQNKIISCLQFRNLIDNTFRTMSANLGPSDSPLSYDFNDILWSDIDNNNKIEEELRGRGRSRSPENKESRKIAHSLPTKPRNKDNSQEPVDSDNDNLRKEKNINVKNDVENSHNVERRSRSSSMSKRINAGNVKILNTRNNSNNSSSIHSSNRDNSNSDKKTVAISSLSILKSLPDNIDIGAYQRGPINGIWLINHPLSSSPQAMLDLSDFINESSLSTNKKIEALLDIQRDYDLKRFDCYEKFLTSKRSTTNDVYIRPNNNNKLKNNKKQVTSSIDRDRGAYYIDTGKALNAW